MSRREIIIPTTCHKSLEIGAVDWVKQQFGEHPTYDQAIHDSIETWGWPWFRVGAIACNSEEKILMIHEGRVQVKKIKDEALRNQYLVEGKKKSDWVDGDGGWNLPSGRVNIGESFEEAVVREVEEEGGCCIEPEEIFHVRYGGPDNPYILPVYRASVYAYASHHRTKEVLETGWFDKAQIQKMYEDNLLRSPEFVMGSLAAYEKIG